MASSGPRIGAQTQARRKGDELIGQSSFSRTEGASSAGCHNPGAPRRSGRLRATGAVAGLVATVALLLSGCGQTPTGLTTGPSPSAGDWKQNDVGQVGTQGYMQLESGGQIVVYGAGTDIWGTTDSFHFSYQTVASDATITTEVKSVKKVMDWTKVGVMFRQSLAPDSPYVFVLLSPDSGTDMQARSSSGGTTFEPGHDPGPRPPYWLRLERTGDTFTGFQSADGSTWTELGSVTVPMSGDVLVGMAVTSRSDKQLANAVFTHTSVDEPAGSAPPPPPPPSGSTTTVTYQSDSSIFPNPERGWYAESTGGSYAKLYGSGYTMAMRYVRLDSYRSSALPSSFLSSLASDFASARGSGEKLVLRFAYNRDSTGTDAPISTVLQHISQLAPLLQQYSDIIAVVQAGFIGAWGEWHNSSNNLTTLSNRTKITNALLDALPADRMIGIRTPQRANTIYPTPPDASTAFDGSNASRVGQHNDCFLSTSNDGGTYSSSADRAYAKQVTTYTAMGGETCDMGGLSTLNDCPNSLDQLATNHWDYLHVNYWRSIYDKWKSQGCYDEVTRRLGYRFELTQVTSPNTLAPGAQVGMAITMTNTGFGKLYNPRPLQLVYVPTAGGSAVTVTVTGDARTVLPLAGDTTTIDVTAALPAGTPSGTYDVYLNLPDASPHLSGDPKYSIRLANQGTWVSSNGTNDLNLQVTVN